MALYGITLVTLAEELWAEDLGLFYLSYMDNAEFDRSAKRSVQLLKLLMGRGLYRGLFCQAVKVAVYCGFTRTGGTGKEVFCGGRYRFRFRRR